MRGRTLFLGVSISVVAALVIVGAVRRLDRQGPQTPVPASYEAPQSPTKTVEIPIVPLTESPVTTPSAPVSADREQSSAVTVPPSSRVASGTPAQPSRGIAAPDAIDGGGAGAVVGSALVRSTSESPIPGPLPPKPQGFLRPASPPSREPETQPTAANAEPANRASPPSSPSPTPTPTPTPANTRVWMVADPAETVVGSALVLHVLIDGASDAASIPFHVVFNPAVLRFESGDEGSFLSGGGQTAFFASPTSTGERVVVGLSRLGAEQGVSGSGELCRLQFTAIGTGDSALAFDRAKVRGARNAILPASFAPARVLIR